MSELRPLVPQSFGCDLRNTVRHSAWVKAELIFVAVFGIQIEKVPGGQIEDCEVLSGVMFNKDIVTPGKMRRRIENPRILLLDCPLEYKKGESMTNVEITKEEDW